MNHTCLCHPAEAGTHLPNREGWKAELALMDSGARSVDSGLQVQLKKEGGISTRQTGMESKVCG